MDNVYSKYNNQSEDQQGTEEDLTNIYGTLHSTINILLRCTFFMTDHRLGHKTIPDNFKSTKTIQSMLSNHNGMKLETNIRNKFEKFICQN